MREERVRKVERELKKALQLLNDIIAKASKGESIEEESKSIWRAYLSAEYSTALLKLDLGVENPGIVSKHRSGTMDPRDSLVESSDSLEEAVEALNQGKVEDSLLYTRKGRDGLRNILLQLRKKQM